jgi:hypothetical protein
LIGGTYHTINLPIEMSFGGGILQINSTGDIIGAVIDQYGHICICIGQCPANQRPCTQ